jgi:Tol biopolymer transport system component
MFRLDGLAVSSRPLRSLPGILLAGSLALGACNGPDNQLAPSTPDEPLAPASAPASSEAVSSDLALLTAPRIVFTSWRQGNAETYKMDPQGTNIARLTTTAGADERLPALSFDNKRIAVMRKRADIGNVIHDDIWVMNSDGTGGHWARPEASPWNLWNPTWSPDGSHLLMTVSVVGYTYLGTMRLSDGQVTLIHPVGGGILALMPKYDQTGQKIVYVNPYTSSIDQVSADGSNHKVLATVAKNPNRPTLSPDGKKLAYSSVIAGTLNEEVFVKNLVTNVTTRLTTSAGPDFEPTWSPDGSKIAFTSHRSGQYQVYVMSATGGTPVRITHTSTIESEPFWSH